MKICSFSNFLKVSFLALNIFIFFFLTLSNNVQFKVYEIIVRMSSSKHFYTYFSCIRAYVIKEQRRTFDTFYMFFRNLNSYKNNCLVCTLDFKKFELTIQDIMHNLLINKHMRSMKGNIL